MMEFIDKLGKPVGLGEVVIVSSGTRETDFAMVIGFTPSQVRTSKGVYKSKETLVVTDLVLGSSMQGMVSQLRSKWASTLDNPEHQKPPTPKYRYFVYRVTGSDPLDKHVIVVKCQADTMRVVADETSKAVIALGFVNTGRERLRVNRTYGVYRASKKKTPPYTFGHDSWGSDKGWSYKGICAVGLDKLIDNPMPDAQFSVVFASLV